jgi:hypothetical protein
VLQVDVFETTRATTTDQLPFYVEPATDEVLISWLLRLAGRLQISVHTLLQEVFQVEPRIAGWRLEHRPAPAVLRRMSRNTGVGLRRLRSMIVQDFAPFGRPGARPSAQDSASKAMYTVGVCNQCLAEDRHPYLRLSWMIGWIGVCFRHHAVLLTHCPRCQAKLRLPSPTLYKEFLPTHCTHCGLALINAKPLPASSSVMALQKLLLTGKRQGKMQLNGLGCLNWSDMVALADVLFDMWTVAGIPDRYFLLQQQEFQDADHPNHRYGNLALLAALLRGWPYSITAEILKHILAKSLARTQPTMHPTQRRSCAALQGESWDWEVRHRVQRRLLGVSSCAIRRRPVPGPHSTNKGHSTNLDRRSRN